jgi:hypothetical protein
VTHREFAQPAYHVVCPACRAIVEALDLDALITAAREHTLDAHSYDIPADHVRQAAQYLGRPIQDTLDGQRNSGNQAPTADRE